MHTRRLLSIEAFALAVFVVLLLLPLAPVGAADPTKEIDLFNGFRAARNMAHSMRMARLKELATSADKPDSNLPGNPAFREARATLDLGAGQEKTVTLDCRFVPERAVIDPEIRVFQLRRKAAVAKL